MILVVLGYKAECFHQGLIQELIDSLPEIVIDALGVTGDVSPRSVVVWVQEFGKMDINTMDLEVVIWANADPARLMHFELRTERITKGVRRFLDGHERSSIRGSVSVFLQPGVSRIF